jgi:hypothetical protein
MLPHLEWAPVDSDTHLYVSTAHRPVCSRHNNARRFVKTPIRAYPFLLLQLRFFVHIFRKKLKVADSHIAPITVAARSKA